MTQRAAVARGLGAVLAGAALAHAAPVLGGARWLRCRLWPGLAGIGDEGQVAVTFDDGPDPASTPAFLAALDELGWRATFFMLGSMVERAPGLAAEVAAAGHEVAVHGYVHRSHLLRTAPAVIDDVRRTVETVTETTGQRPVWFRPPYGALSGGTVLAARRLDLRLVLWSAWGRDWRPAATPQSVVADLRRGLGPGGTILLHDTDCTSAHGSWRSALGALPQLAEILSASNLRTVRLSEHLAAPARDPGRAAVPSAG